jgi:hypothetical protein
MLVESQNPKFASPAHVSGQTHQARNVFLIRGAHVTDARGACVDEKF